MSTLTGPDSKLARVIVEAEDLTRAAFQLGTAIHFGVSEETVSRLIENSPASSMAEFMQSVRLDGPPSAATLNSPSRRELLDRIQHRLGTSPDAEGEEWSSTPQELIQNAANNRARAEILDAINRDSEGGIVHTLDTSLAACCADIRDFPFAIAREFGVDVSGLDLRSLKTVRDLTDYMIYAVES